MISKILFWNLFTSKGIYMIDWVGPNRTYAWWVMSYIWMSRTTHMSESCHTYGWVMSHIWMSHATHMNESCPTHNWWIMVDMSMSHATHMNDSWHTYEWVVSCRWMRHATYMNESCPTYEWWIMAERWMSHVTHTNESCLYNTHMSFNLILQSQSNWSLFNGTWQKRRRELEKRLSFEIGELTLQMQ